MVKEASFKGLKSLQLENENLKVLFLPDYGSKMVSLYNKQTDREFLFQHPESKLKKPEYGANYAEFDASGFDEMFPTIDSTFYPDGPLAGTFIPDHGEVWTLKWSYVITGEKQIRFSVLSHKLPCKLTKSITLNKKGLKINYNVVNNSTDDLKFLWAAHPLLNCNHKYTKILLPPEVDRVINVESGNKHLGKWGTIHSYPLTNSLKTGESIDISRVSPPESGTCEKFYFPNSLQEGRSGVHYEDTDEKIIFEFPVDRVPYLGVWKTQGGFRGDYNIALEPCTAIFDDLYLASKIDRISQISAGGNYNWYLKIKLIW